MTSEQLASIAGVVLSLLLAYIPKLSDWYNTKDTAAKARIMGGLLMLTALGIFGLSCAHVITVAALAAAVSCDKAGLLELMQILIAALIANQATFMLAVRPFKK